MPILGCRLHPRWRRAAPPRRSRSRIPRAKFSLCSFSRRARRVARESDNFISFRAYVCTTEDFRRRDTSSLCDETSRKGNATGGLSIAATVTERRPSVTQGWQNSLIPICLIPRLVSDINLLKNIPPCRGERGVTCLILDQACVGLLCKTLAALPSFLSLFRFFFLSWRCSNTHETLQRARMHIRRPAISLIIHACGRNGGRAFPFPVWKLYSSNSDDDKVVQRGNGSDGSFDPGRVSPGAVIAPVCARR